jgi:hypothetical protein
MDGTLAVELGGRSWQGLAGFEDRATAAIRLRSRRRGRAAPRRDVGAATSPRERLEHLLVQRVLSLPAALAADRRTRSAGACASRSTSMHRGGAREPRCGW